MFGQYIPNQGDPFAPGVPKPEIRIQEVKFSVQERVAVTMGWDLVKALHELLGNHIKRFEELNGEIKQNVVPIL